MEEFILKATLAVDDGNGSIEESSYRLGYVLNLLNINNNNALIYDKELKIHFEKKSAITYLYEIETKEVELSLSDKLKKSEDFNRRLFYRYDWMQVIINANGRLLSIENKNELKETWNELKRNILTDYKGRNLLRYLEQIDEEFEQDKAFIFALRQYLHYGLMFPGIPFEHGEDWSRKKQAGISEYEREYFEECITYTGTENGIRAYKVNGNTLPGSKTRLTKYSGTIKVRENEWLPLETVVDVAFNWGPIAICWQFRLERLKTDIKDITSAYINKNESLN